MCKPSAIGQQTRPTQLFYPFWVDSWVVSCNWMTPTSVRSGAIWWTLTKERQARFEIYIAYKWRYINTFPFLFIVSVVLHPPTCHQDGRKDGRTDGQTTPAMKCTGNSRLTSATDIASCRRQIAWIIHRLMQLNMRCILIRYDFEPVAGDDWWFCVKSIKFPLLLITNISRNIVREQNLLKIIM